MNIRGNFIKILILSLLFFGTLGKAAEYLGEARPPTVTDERILRIARAIHIEVEEISASIAERSSADQNIEEICFRVGILYHLARRDLQGLLRKDPLGASEKRYARDTIRYSRLLPGFCGDEEKISMDPEQFRVPKGDVDDLLMELKAIDASALELIEEAS